MISSSDTEGSSAFYNKKHHILRTVFFRAAVAFSKEMLLILICNLLPDKEVFSCCISTTQKLDIDNIKQYLSAAHIENVQLNMDDGCVDLSFIGVKPLLNSYHKDTPTRTRNLHLGSHIEKSSEQQRLLTALYKEVKQLLLDDGFSLLEADSLLLDCIEKRKDLGQVLRNIFSKHR